ncbi:MAG: DUF3810 domain-containing protein [Candidatus Aminicenantes bacterium]|jgi:hypothetical protein
MKKLKKINLKVMMILLGVGALLVRFLFSLNPYITEAIYSKGIFLGIRFCLDYTIELLPFPLIYLLVILLILWDVKIIMKWIRVRKNKNREKISLKALFLRGLLYCAAFLGALVFLFYFLWGFNYERLPIETHLKIKPEPLDINEIRSEAKLAFQMVVDARETIPGVKHIGNHALDNRFLLNMPKKETFEKTPPKERHQADREWVGNATPLEDKIRESMEGVLKSMGYPTVGRVRVKKLWPGGFLMRFGASGFYLPFTGEAYISANLTPVEIPFAVAHEMAHGYGFSQEGTANFLAYLACISSEHPFIKYSGCLVYFSHISADLYRAAPEEYRELNKKLPPGIIADRVKKYKNWQQYQGWLMDWSQKVYDTYLKTQGIREGIKSYDRLVILTAAWRKAGESK